MQDRFKFRFWDKETQTMQKIPMVELRHRITLDNIFADDRVVFMQCTGLKDKNGKLIFEGDLLKPLCEDDELIEIVWNEEIARFGLMIQWRDPCYWNGLHEETKTGRGYYDFDEYYVEDFEVIGNIYENPELLEVK